MNASAAHAQISHESETQRQYPRFSLPSRGLLNGKECIIKNLSAGGAALCKVEGSFSRGKKIAIDLVLPFKGFSLGTTLNAEVVYCNSAEKTVGCRFVNQGTEQISFLNHAIKSFIAGEIVTAENVLNIAARNNFTKSRAHANGNAAGTSFMRQLPGLILVLIIGVLIAALIAGNLYNSMFIVKAGDAAVTGPLVAVRTMTEGVYRSQLDPGLTLIRKNQDIGSVTPAGGNAVVIQSPCDCYITKTYAANGELISHGQQIMSLVPMNSVPWIVAEIDPDQGKKISPDSVATVSVFGSRHSYTGRVVSMESPLADHRTGGSRTVLMKIILQQKLPVDFVNRLAAVTFAIH